MTRKEEIAEFYQDIADTANMEIGYWTGKALTLEEARNGLGKLIAELKTHPNYWAAKYARDARRHLDAGDIDAELADIIAQYARHGEVVYG